MKENIESRVRLLIKQNTNIVEKDVEEIEISEDLFSLGMVSIDCIRLITSIEEEFNIEFDIKDLNINTVRNIKNLVGYIDTKVNL